MGTKRNKCYSFEAKNFENRLNELNITYEQFKELVKMHGEMTDAGRAEVNNLLREQCE